MKALLVCEKLAERHNIDISVSTARSLMIDSDIWLTRNRRKKRSYQPQNRRNCCGELIQIDGSLHDWFEGRGAKCSLLVYIDDATSRLMTLYFAPSESMHTYFLATEQYINNYGKPVAFYSDKLSVFRINSKTTQEKVVTQFTRGLCELKIDIIYANTPQAKGRVERANRTLQDRLVKEFRLHNINCIEDANDFMPEFIEQHNKCFAKPHALEADAHRPLQEHEGLKTSLWKKLFLMFPLPVYRSQQLNFLFFVWDEFFIGIYNDRRFC